jgi:hypothetical protein
MMMDLQAAAQLLRVPQSLCTVTARNTLVPWLAAKGPYSYAPENAPRDSKFFDYGHIMPSIFAAPGRYLFGTHDPTSDNANLQLNQYFWNAAKDNLVTPVFKAEGRRTEDGFTAPIAVYQFSLFDRAYYALIQNGSYQILFADEHPEIKRGAIRLYRGTVYKDIHLQRGSREIHDLRMDFVAMTFLSSAWAFVEAHRSIQKARTNHIRKLREIYDSYRTFIAGDILASNSDGDAYLWEITKFDRLCFSTKKRQAGVFGLNIISLETPLTNIRISSGYLSEFEAKLIDPEKTTMK